MSFPAGQLQPHFKQLATSLTLDCCAYDWLFEPYCMKYCMLVFLGLIVSLSARAQVSLTQGPDPVASYSSDTVKDLSGHVVLVFASNNDVRDGNGDLMLTTSGTSVIDLNGASVGSIESNGQVLDSNGNLLGTTSGSSVIDSNGDVIGSFGTMPSDRAAIYYFFAYAINDL